ncbi:MAG TPA: histidine kinase dimerization/phospho-acceptor domain-containing protein [Gemmatimonadales bacterium]|nr:histidine kinase dimerization/phospho-acceptor domain-containing protein [Gemmatimonadales bacterium]
MAGPPGAEQSEGAPGAGVLRKLRHDLSNPLAAVLAETQLLLLNPERLSPDVTSSLQQIEALARRMRQILEDLDP